MSSTSSTSSTTSSNPNNQFLNQSLKYSEEINLRLFVIFIITRSRSVLAYTENKVW